MTQETDREKAERWCEMATARLDQIRAADKLVAELDTALVAERKAASTLRKQRDGLLGLIALAMSQGGGK